jgi:hypothetical protein
MARTGICSTCSRTDADAIDAALAVSGASWRAVARRFGLGRSAVNRHGNKCMASRLKRAADTRAQGSDPQLLDKVLELHRLTKGILGEAVRARDWSATAALIGRAQQQIELQGRLLGALRDGEGGTTVNVHIDEATAQRMAQTFLQRRGLLPSAASPAIETTAEKAGDLVVAQPREQR